MAPLVSIFRSVTGKRQNDSPDNEDGKPDVKRRRTSHSQNDTARVRERTLNRSSRFVLILKSLKRHLILCG